ncbi:MAG: hypothetical protein ABIP94_15375, partial [Planctomycetota bacterium]
MVASTERAFAHFGALLSCLLALASSASGQVVAGQVRGFDDQPARGVVVRVFDGGSHRIGEVLTDEDGRFEWLGEQAIGAIEIQNEGVVVVKTIANGGDPKVFASFAGT